MKLFAAQIRYFTEKINDEKIKNRFTKYKTRNEMFMNFIIY